MRETMGLHAKSSYHRNGIWKEWNKHAVLISEGEYVNDKKHGLWKEYYDFGGIMIEESYHLGVQHGRFASFHPNGQLLSEGNFVHGKREGYFRVYNETGVRVRTMLFHDNSKLEDIEEDMIADRT